MLGSRLYSGKWLAVVEAGGELQNYLRMRSFVVDVDQAISGTRSQTSLPAGLLPHMRQ
jgi:hypothetical protein